MYIFVKIFRFSLIKNFNRVPQFENRKTSKLLIFYSEFKRMNASYNDVLDKRKPFTA